jgi:trigger factor
VFELTKEILESHEAILTLDVDPKAERKALEKTVRHISRNANIPGFRKGKAPANVIMRMFGREAVMAEVVEDLLETAYPQALEQAEIEPYGPGHLEDFSLNPMVIKLRVPLAPQVDLGDYESIRMEPESVEVTADELNEALEHIREENAVLDPVDRPAELGDKVILGIVEGAVDGDVFLHEHDMELPLDVEHPVISPEFIAALVDLEAGDEKTFTLTLPADFDETLAGEEAEFTVEVDEVYSRALPELDDALASTVGNFETLDELRADLRERMLEYKQEHARETYRARLVEKLMAQAEIHYPPDMVEDKLDDMVEQFRQRVENAYNITWEDFLEMQAVTEEQLREDLRSQAIDELERGLALSEFAVEMDVTVSDDEVKAELGNIMTQQGVTNPALLEAFRPDTPMVNDLRNSVLGRKTLTLLERLAQGLPLEEPAPETSEAELDTTVEAPENEGDLDDEVEATEGAT